MHKFWKKFKTWMDFDPPSFADTDQWTDWELAYRKKAPVRYWITHKCPEPFRAVKWKFEHLSDEIRYRVVRYHVLHTGLKAGYYDKDTLMLNVNFNLLKNFVEVEKAWMQYICHKEEQKNFYKTKFDYIMSKLPYYERATFCSKELGLKYLDWEMTLDDPSLPAFEQNKGQAENAREVVELYRWWIESRPAREELECPEDGIGVGDDMPAMYHLSDRYKKDHPEEYAKFKKWCTEHTDQEEQWRKEDDIMLARLIKIRQSLWT